MVHTNLVKKAKIILKKKTKISHKDMIINKKITSTKTPPKHSKVYN